MLTATPVSVGNRGVTVGTLPLFVIASPFLQIDAPSVLDLQLMNYQQGRLRPPQTASPNQT